MNTEHENDKICATLVVWKLNLCLIYRYLKTRKNILRKNNQFKLINVPVIKIIKKESHLPDFLIIINVGVESMKYIYNVWENEMCKR